MHYRLEVRFCNPYSGNEKGSVENAVGFLRRNIMVPMLNAESHGQLTRYMLERCDAMAKETHYRKGAPIGGLFAGAAAAVEVFGLYDSYYLQFLTNVGMDGLLVAVMAKKKPLYIPVTAFVMAYIRQAAAVLNANTNIPIELVTMLSSVIILFVAAEEFLGGFRRKVIFNISRKAEAEAKKGESLSC